jgi:hypothetical protein
VAEIPYTPEEHGWFRVSRRLFQSSRAMSLSLAGFKLLVYFIERASAAVNPYPGDVLETGLVLAHNVGLTVEQTEAALAELCGPDPYSQSPVANGAVLEPLTRDGRIVGYRLINFEAHNPGALARAEAVRAVRRSEQARHAALKRWNRAKAAAQELQPSDIPAREPGAEG